MRTRNGFTLLEVLIYAVIFLIVIGVIVNTAFNLTLQSQETVAQEYLIDETDLIFERVIRDLGAGSVLNTGSSTLGVDSSVVSFTTGVGGLGDTLVYSVNNGDLQKTINGGEAVNVNSDEINVTRFLVENINPGSDVTLLRVTLETSNDYNQTYNLTSSVNFLND